MQHQKCRICGERHPLGPCAVLSAAQYRRRALDRETAPDTPSAYGRSSAVAALPVANAVNALPPEVRAKAAAAFIEQRAQFAPPEECPYCDYRRAKVAEAVRLHRARKAGKITE